MTDHLVHDLRRLAETPVHGAIDHDRVVRDGRRRVRRRRAALASVATAGVVCAVVTLVPGQSGGPGPASEVAIDPAAAPSTTLQPTPTPPPATEPVSSPAKPDLKDLGDGWDDVRTALDEAIEAAGTGQLGGGSMSPTPEVGGYEAMFNVIRVGQVQAAGAGYLGATVRSLSTEGCDTPLHPVDGRGRTCATDSDDDGTWTRLEWDASRQGRVLAVQVRDAGLEVTVAISRGTPQYDDSNRGAPARHELPWNSFSVDEDDDVLPVPPPIDQDPLDEEQLLALARTIIVIHS